MKSYVRDHLLREGRGAVVAEFVVPQANPLALAEDRLVEIDLAFLGLSLVNLWSEQQHRNNTGTATEQQRAGARCVTQR